VQLEEAGLLHVEKQTFKSLTAAQRALGLPLPYRNDDGQAPDLLTLLMDGVAAYSFEYPMRTGAQTDGHDKPGPDEPFPGIARTVPHGQVVQGEPRTKAVETPPDKMADDLQGSAYLSRNVEGDPEERPRPTSEVGDTRENVAPSSNSQPAPDAPVDLDAWRALIGAYKTHYRRVYHSAPTNSRVPLDGAQAMTAHLLELTVHFKARLSERGVALENLAMPPLWMLADEALRSWFDSAGAKGFLRRVSHRMRELVADLPYRVRKAMETLVERYAPKSAPRRVIALESASRDAGRGVMRDKPRPMKLPMPTFYQMHADAGPRPQICSGGTNISPGIQQILDGLSARPTLREFGTHTFLATEIEVMARERGMTSAQVSRALDELAQAARRMEVLTPPAKTNALFAAAVKAFGEERAGDAGGGA